MFMSLCVCVRHQRCICELLRVWRGREDLRDKRLHLNASTTYLPLGITKHRKQLPSGVTDSSHIIAARLAIRLRRRPLCVAFVQLSKRGTHTENREVRRRMCEIAVIWLLSEQTHRELLCQDVAGPPRLSETKQTCLCASRPPSSHHTTHSHSSLFNFTVLPKHRSPPPRCPCPH